MAKEEIVSWPTHQRNIAQLCVNSQLAPKGGKGEFRSAFFKMCLVLVFLNTIVEETYPEPRNYLQFHDQKALFKVPKICNIIFRIENDTPPPLALFQKFIRFGSATLPYHVQHVHKDQSANNLQQIVKKKKK